MIRQSLHPLKFTPLTLGTIHPHGWLRDQLRTQANSLSGHLDEFWPDVRDSQWFGGDSEAWERAPYWLDGLIPLAYVLDDAALKAKVTRYVNYILDHQDENGWLGPQTMIAAAGRAADAHYDIWAQLLATKVLVQYHDATGASQALGALEKNLRMLDRHIDRGPLFNWGQFRWFEVLIAIYWLYEKLEESWLLDLAIKLHAQGFDWASFFARWPSVHPTPKGRWNYMSHVVNNAMAIKAHALWWRLSGDDRDRKAVYEIVSKLDQHHGMVTGVFTGDECLAGKRPTQGTELCAVVEHAFSLEVLLSVLGDPAWGDRLEKTVFNALPATFSPDMWSHQYDQQVNQIECSVRENRLWNTNGPASNTFGVEPNYGCCTANLSQGWPKFAAHLWMRTKDDGLAAIAYAPSSVDTTIKSTPVTVNLETGYPFRDTLTVTVQTRSAVTFPLLLRIPGWAKGATLDTPEGRIHPQPGTFARLEREWNGTIRLGLTLPMSARLSTRYNGAVAIERGPLVYAIQIGEDWRRINEDAPYRELPHADWEIYPTTPWNYALQVHESTLTDDVTFAERPIGDRPFSPDKAPVHATVYGRRVPEWQAENGSAADVPTSPVSTSEPLEKVTLIPYGCTNLRIAEFPTIRKE